MQTNIPELRAVHNFFRRGLNLVEYAGLLAIAFATTFALCEEIMLMIGAGKVTLMMGVDPLLDPANGPNWFPFDDEILYELKVDNNNDAREDITIQFRFETEQRLPSLFQVYAGFENGAMAPSNSPAPSPPANPSAPRPRTGWSSNVSAAFPSARPSCNSTTAVIASTSSTPRGTRTSPKTPTASSPPSIPRSW